MSNAGFLLFQVPQEAPAKPLPALLVVQPSEDSLYSVVESSAKSPVREEQVSPEGESLSQQILTVTVLRNCPRWGAVGGLLG